MWQTHAQDAKTDIKDFFQHHWKCKRWVKMNAFEISLTSLEITFRRNIQYKVQSLWWGRAGVTQQQCCWEYYSYIRKYTRVVHAVIITRSDKTTRCMTQRRQPCCFYTSVTVYLLPGKDDAYKIFIMSGNFYVLSGWKRVSWSWTVSQQLSPL